MHLDSSPTVSEALAALHAANGLDPVTARAASWTCRIGPVVVRLPNFAWRRDAILRHDLHHLLTGYACTMRGECQVATWEFAAGRFPHPAATLFCLPLVLLGVLWSPRAIWLAFRRGRKSRSLYVTAMTDAMLHVPLAALRIETEMVPDAPARIRDIVVFSLLIGRASLLVGAPIAIAAVVATSLM